MPKTPEGFVLDACLDYLAAKRILAFRMGVGAMKLDNRFMRWGTPGMADVLSFPKIRQQDLTSYGEKHGLWYDVPTIVWIECKAGKGKQSALQASFQQLVESHGHRYCLVRSVDELEALLNGSE